MPLVSGGGGGAFNGGTITQPLVIAPADPAVTPLTIALPVGAAASGNYAWRVTSNDLPSPPTDMSYADVFGSIVAFTSHTLQGVLQLYDYTDGKSRLLVKDTGVIGTAPPVPATVQLVTATAHQMSTLLDVRAFTPVTFNPTAGAAATCLVQLSPDNVTYTTLWTETEPAGIAFDGTVHVVRVDVPVGWYIKLTVTNATLGLTAYY